MKPASVVGGTEQGCPCGSQAPPHPLFRTATRQYVRCPHCRLVFLHPRPSPELLEGYFRETYDGAYGEAESSDDRRPVFESVLEHVSAYRRPPGTILDIGCGDGEFLMLCRAAGWTGTGIELSQGAAIRAAKKGFTMLPPQALDRPEGAGQFDVVTLINVLETVVDPVAMLRQVAGALTPEGVVVVRATNGAFHLALRAPAAWIGSRYDQAFHWYLYTTTALSRLMAQAGLEVIGLRNSTPSEGPPSPAHPRWSRVKWSISRAVIRPLSQALYSLSGGRLLCAPSFEIAARRSRP